MNVAGGSVRSFESGGERWVLVSDLCRVHGVHLQPNGSVNVTHAVREIASQDIVIARVETAPGTLKPLSKMLCIRQRAALAVLPRPPAEMPVIGMRRAAV